jgi:nitrate/nitrite-specific signal transduction histidine kinase
MIERPGLGDTGETYLVGSNYRLLTYLRRPGYMIPDTYVRTAGTEAALESRRTGSAAYESYAGDKVIGVYSWVPGLQVALVAEQKEAEALAPTRRTLWIIGGVAVAAAVLAIMAGFGLTRRIVRPLVELGDTAGRIAGGELDLRASVVREDEIGTLAHAFNRMTGQLGLLVTNLQRRTERLRAIDETGRQISSILELEELLPYVAKSILETFGYEMVRVFHLTDCCSGRLVTCARQTCGPPLELSLADTVHLDERGLWDAAAIEPAASGAAYEAMTEDGTPDLRAIATVARTEEAVIPEAGGLELAVPIRIGDRMAGVLDIIAPETRPLDEEDVLAARTLADQLAIAIENSRLYEQASELAAGQERQRLARDLHDAVSQTLFSVSLIAEVLPRIYARDPDQGAKRLEELRQLTRGALAEMRTLLLELRPAALAEANLPDLLKQLGEAVTGRARIPVEVVSEETGMPAEVARTGLRKPPTMAKFRRQMKISPLTTGGVPWRTTEPAWTPPRRAEVSWGWGSCGNEPRRSRAVSSSALPRGRARSWPSPGRPRRPRRPRNDWSAGQVPNRPFAAGRRCRREAQLTHEDTCCR